MKLNKFIFLIIILASLIIGCGEKLLEKQLKKEFISQDGLSCFSSLNDKNLKSGQFTCYNESGIELVKGEFRNDTIINEWFNYELNGRLIKYRFYNTIGEINFERVYNNLGSIESQFGEPYIQTIVNPYPVVLGEKVTLSVYVANPPESNAIVFGIWEDSIKDVFVESRSGTVYDYTFEPKTIGDKIAPILVRFEDNLLDTITEFKENINFLVVKRE